MTHLLRHRLLLLLLLPCWASCSKSEAPVLTALSCGGHIIQVEIADTPQQQAKGLMFRKSLPENQGMLFRFDAPSRRSFWMANTLIPLSVAFLNSDGLVLEIRDLQPLDERSVSSQSEQVLYALETNLGWFEKRGIKAGDRFILPDRPE